MREAHRLALDEPAGRPTPPLAHTPFGLAGANGRAEHSHPVSREEAEVSTHTRILLFVILALLLVPVVVAMAADGFDDVPTGSVFHDDIAWLADAGITKGCNPPANTEFCPTAPVTRQQTAAFLHRFARYLGAEDGTVSQADALSSAGVYWAEGRALIPAGSIYTGVVASCDDGDFATGAGWIIEGDDEVERSQLRVVSSLPEWVYAMDGTSEGWQVGFDRITHDTSVDVSVYVQCLDLTP